LPSTVVLNVKLQKKKIFFFYKTEEEKIISEKNKKLSPIYLQQAMKKNY